MSGLWQLTARYTLMVIVVASVSGLGIWQYWGSSFAGSFWYGVAVGLVTLVSTALSVSLLTAGSSAWRVVAGVSFMLRYGFVAAALGVPAYLEAWPVLAMMGGFAMVYLLENVIILPAVIGAMGRLKSSSYGGSGRLTEDKRRKPESPESVDGAESRDRMEKRVTV